MTEKYLSVSEYNLMPRVKAFLSKELKNCIDGKWLSAASGETFEKKTLQQMKLLHMHQKAEMLMLIWL